MGYCTGKLYPLFDGSVLRLRKLQKENVMTINEPPATATYDIANKCHELRDHDHDCHGLGRQIYIFSSCCRSQLTYCHSAIAQLATAALNLAKHITEQSAEQIPMPHTPKHARTHHMAKSNYSPSSQPLFSPSNISCFMKYAKEKLEITNVASYITPLQKN